jgi:hypothetical protein
MGGTGLEPVTPSLRWSLRTLPAAAFALVLGLRPPLQLAPVSTAAAPSSRREFCSPTSASRSAAVTATRSHRRRWVVEFCHRGVGICTDINDHVPLQSDPALPVTRRDSRPQPSAWQRLRRRDGVDDRWPRSRSRSVAAVSNPPKEFRPIAARPPHWSPASAGCPTHAALGRQMKPGLHGRTSDVDALQMPSPANPRAHRT